MQQQRHALAERNFESEETLVRQSLAGDQEAFAALVHRYETLLLAYIRNHLGPKADDVAYDVFQHVLLQFYCSLPTLSTGRSLKPWLFRVAHNRCIDILRSSKRVYVLPFSELEAESDEDDTSLLGIIQDTQPLPEEVVEQHEIHQQFHQAVQALPARYRSIVLFRCLYQMSFPEIAQQMKIPNATVRTYFHRARLLLRTALQI